MHASQLSQIALVVARHGTALVQATQRLDEHLVQNYWTLSKCRFDRWQGAFAKLRDAHPPSGDQRTGLVAQQVAPLLEEILASEPLTRVWTILIRAIEQRLSPQKRVEQQEAEPLVRSVLLGHMEARNRLLRILLDGKLLSAEQALALNQLRRRLERWTDLLIGQLSDLDPTFQLAFDRDRARDFSSPGPKRPGQREIAWSMTEASLAVALGSKLSMVSCCGELNERIAQAILALLPAELFHTTGVPCSVWQLRLSTVTTDTQGMVDELFLLDELSSADPTLHSSRSNRFSSR